MWNDLCGIHDLLTKLVRGRGEKKNTNNRSHSIYKAFAWF